VDVRDSDFPAAGGGEVSYILMMYVRCAAVWQAVDLRGWGRDLQGAVDLPETAQAASPAASGPFIDVRRVFTNSRRRDLEPRLASKTR